MESRTLEQEYDVIRHHWDGRAGTFDREWSQGLLSEEQHDAWLRTLARIAGTGRKRILDVGCGTGFLSLLLAELGHDVTGIDLAPRMLEVAREKARRSGLSITFRVENAASLSDADASYDLVICRHVIWILPDPARGAAEWIRVLRPGGRLALIEGKWWDAGGKAPPKTLRSRVRTMLDDGFAAAARALRVKPRNLYARNYQRLQLRLPFSGGADPERLLALLRAQGLRDVTMEPLTERALWGKDPDGLRYAALGTR
jgi:ubiquinone/menaquinone biosynthesis C-methylase UbiE